MFTPAVAARTFLRRKTLREKQLERKPHDTHFQKGFDHGTNDIFDPTENNPAYIAGVTTGAISKGYKANTKTRPSEALPLREDYREISLPSALEPDLFLLKLAAQSSHIPRARARDLADLDREAYFEDTYAQPGN